MAVAVASVEAVVAAVVVDAGVKAGSAVAIKATSEAAAVVVVKAASAAAAEAAAAVVVGTDNTN